MEIPRRLPTGVINGTYDDECGSNLGIQPEARSFVLRLRKYGDRYDRRQCKSSMDERCYFAAQFGR
jgi:hypothetical protein